MLPLLPFVLLSAGSGLALYAGWRLRRDATAPPIRWLAAWGLGVAGVLAGVGLEFGRQGLPDHAAMGLAASLSLLLGHAAGLLLLRLSPGRPVAGPLGLAMTLGLPPLGAFPGLWLGLQSIQSALLLLPAWPSLAFAAAGLAALAGGVWAWQGGLRALRAETSASGRNAWRGLLVALGLLAGFLPWLWVLPAQIAAAWWTQELPMLLIALGLMLTPVIPGQASVIPFGLLAIAMALISVLLLVLRLTRRPR